MHIELTEMLRCPEPHAEAFLVLSTAEMSGRSVVSGVVGCPVCRREYEIVKGVVEFAGMGNGEWHGESPVPSPHSPPESPTLQALLDLSGPGGYVVLLGSASRHAVGLASLMQGIHFIGINAPADAEDLPILSLLRSEAAIPLKSSMARAIVVGSDVAAAPWLAEAHRVLLRGRRLVIETETATPPQGVNRLAAGQGMWVGEKS
jgi:uncharacterized protein YbaR (Trm112 family)